MTNTLDNRIEEEINRRFLKKGAYYIPIDPGRQEYRKCGIKEECLLLSIEEALFDLISPSEPKENIGKYAEKKGYRHFLAYASIRQMGWILIPWRPDEKEKEKSFYRSISTQYIYKIYRPDKNFNRKKSEEIGYLIMVLPSDKYTPAYFTETRSRQIVFAVSDNDSFVLIDGKLFEEKCALFSEYVPCKRE